MFPNKFCKFGGIVEMTMLAKNELILKISRSLTEKVSVGDV